MTDPKSKSEDKYKVEIPEVVRSEEFQLAAMGAKMAMDKVNVAAHMQDEIAVHSALKDAGSFYDRCVSMIEKGLKKFGKVGPRIVKPIK